MVDYVADALRILDRPIAEQVIEVPKISCSPCPSRVPILVPQMAEQLVEVPTVLTPTRIAVQIAEQIVGIPVPQGFGGKRRLQGLLPEQSSTATPSSKKRISERTVEQNVDIPVSGGGLHGSRPGQGSSSSSHSPAGVQDDADEPGEGVFRTFPQHKEESAKLASHSSPRVPASVSPSTRAAQLKVAPLPDSIEFVQLSVGDTGKTF